MCNIEPNPPAPERPADKHLRVLVVDDEPLIRWSLSQMLSHTGHTVVGADSGSSAIHALTGGEAPVDVVLLDYRLPDSHGLELLATIRRLSPDSPVIMMTAHGTPDVIDGAAALGVAHIVQKPFDLDQVGTLVEETHGSFMLQGRHAS